MTEKNDIKPAVAATIAISIIDHSLILDINELRNDSKVTNLAKVGITTANNAILKMTRWVLPAFEVRRSMVFCVLCVILTISSRILDQASSLSNH